MVDPLLAKKNELIHACSYQTTTNNPTVRFYLASDLDRLGDLFSQKKLGRDLASMVQCYTSAKRLNVGKPSEYAQRKLVAWAGELYAAAAYNISRKENMRGAESLLELACECIPNYEPAVRMLRGLNIRRSVPEITNHVSCVNYINLANSARHAGDLSAANQWLDLAAGCPDYKQYMGGVSKLRQQIQDAPTLNEHASF